MNSRTRKHIFSSFAIIGGLALLIWAAFPDSFSTDLDRIGKGKPAIALIYDMENEASGKLMEGYNAIRHEYEHAVEFLLVDTASPQGRSFLRQQPSDAGTALYYSADGKRLMVLHGPQEHHVLADSIKSTFGLD
ncbi:MAG: hypothetical protein OEW58_07815 [Gammaproteobacteria bacterium]|nr:hypothetical protein [Gammaproteobacteria bacterium]